MLKVFFKKRDKKISGNSFSIIILKFKTAKEPLQLVWPHLTERSQLKLIFNNYNNTYLGVFKKKKFSLIYTWKCLREYFLQKMCNFTLNLWNSLHFIPSSKWSIVITIQYFQMLTSRFIQITNFIVWGITYDIKTTSNIDKQIGHL